MRQPLQQDLERAVRQYVSLATGIISNNVIPGTSNAPSLNGDYATVLLIDTEPLGTNSITQNIDFINDKVQNIIRGSQIIPFSVQFYRSPNVNDYARSLIDFASTPNGRYALASLGLTFNKCSKPRQLNTLMADQFENRVQVDISFAVSSTEIQIIPTLESADIQISEDIGNAVIDDEFLVN